MPQSHPLGGVTLIPSGSLSVCYACLSGSASVLLSCSLVFKLVLSPPLFCLPSFLPTPLPAGSPFPKRWGFPRFCYVHVGSTQGPSSLSFSCTMFETSLKTCTSYACICLSVCVSFSGHTNQKQTLFFPITASMMKKESISKVK
jgi:hypothetical protein